MQISRRGLEHNTHLLLSAPPLYGLEGCGQDGRHDAVIHGQQRPVVVRQFRQPANIRHLGAARGGVEPGANARHLPRLRQRRHAPLAAPATTRSPGLGAAGSGGLRLQRPAQLSSGWGRGRGGAGPLGKAWPVHATRHVLTCRLTRIIGLVGLSTQTSLALGWARRLASTLPRFHVSTKLTVMPAWTVQCMSRRCIPP